MQTVTSADGTTIAYERHGDGQPVVLVHGSSASRASWAGFRPLLPDGFAPVVFDRRGRGASGDADDHGLEREVADLRAVLDALDTTPVVFGHSFGGLVALETAREADIDRLVLYEPSILTGDHRDATLAAEMQECLDADDPEAAVELFFREAGGADDLSQLPVAECAPLADTIVRESRAVERYRLPDDLDVSVPTLLLTGEYGPEHLRDAVSELHDALPDNRLVEIPGAGHVGISSAPRAVADEVRPFLRGERRGGSD